MAKTCTNRKPSRSKSPKMLREKARNAPKMLWTCKTGSHDQSTKHPCPCICIWVIPPHTEKNICKGGLSPFWLLSTCISSNTAEVFFMFISFLWRRFVEFINVAISIKSFVFRIFLWQSNSKEWNGNESSIVEGTQWALERQILKIQKAKWGKNHTAISRFDENHLRLLESGHLVERSKKIGELLFQFHS